MTSPPDRSSVDDPAVYIALRIADLPVPHVPSERLRCSDCDEPVWVDPIRHASVKLSHAAVRVLCSRCHPVEV